MVSSFLDGPFQSRIFDSRFFNDGRQNREAIQKYPERISPDRLGFSRDKRVFPIASTCFPQRFPQVCSLLHHAAACRAGRLPALQMKRAGACRAASRLPALHIGKSSCASSGQIARVTYRKKQLRVGRADCPRYRWKEQLRSGQRADCPRYSWKEQLRSGQRADCPRCKWETWLSALLREHAVGAAIGRPQPENAYKFLSFSDPYCPFTSGGRPLAARNPKMLINFYLSRIPIALSPRAGGQWPPLQYDS